MSQQDLEKQQREQRERDEVNRHSTLVHAMRYAQAQEDSTVVLLQLTDELGLHEELADLVDGSPERQRSVELVTEQLLADGLLTPPDARISGMT